MSRNMLYTIILLLYYQMVPSGAIGALCIFLVIIATLEWLVTDNVLTVKLENE